jgi:hypothetical protein
VLQVNAIASAACGLLIIAAAPLGEMLGIPPHYLWPVGAALLPFAWWVWRTATSMPLDRRSALAITIADFVWVLGSALLLFGGFLPLTPIGWWFVLAPAVAVLCFAELEALGLWRERSL